MASQYLFMRNFLCHANKEVTNKDGKLREVGHCMHQRDWGWGEKIHVNKFYIYLNLGGILTVWKVQ